MSSPYATGGTIIQGTYGVDAGYLHVFDTPGGANFVPLYILNCTVVVIAGGGAGGASSTTAGSETSGGGGGAGGYGIRNFPTIDPLAVANYAITVGDGATTSASSGNSAFIAQPLLPPSVPIMEAGGGGNGGNGVIGDNGIVAITGTYNFRGCGGGGGSTENAGTATNDGGAGYFKGGDSQNNPTVLPFTAGGGGGYTSKGGDRNDLGVGGGGIVNPFADFTGQSAKVCAGGGGGEELASAGNGGDGGGGNGANSAGIATSGFTYGSGGGGAYSVNNTPGFGFKGAVMIFYPTPPPADPVSGLGIIATSFEEQTISWIAPIVADEYYVYVTANPSNYGSPIIVSAPATNFTANTASVGFTYLPYTTYYFRVVVRVTGKPNSNPVDTNGQTSAPPAPTGFSVTVNNPTSQTVSWTEPNPAPTSYNFYATTNPSNYGSPTTLNPPDVSRTLTSLTPGTTYYYRINADHTIGGNSYPSANVDTSAVTPVPPPTGFTVSVNTQTSQTLTWTAPSPTPATYNFYFTTNPSNYGSPTSIAGGLTSRVQSGLTAGTTYYYRIVAVNNSVSSTNVDTSATTPSPAPAGLYYKPLQIRSPVGRGVNDYPGRHPGRGLPATQTLWMSSL